jgi:hypothetical protein
MRAHDMARSRWALRAAHQLLDEAELEVLEELPSARMLGKFKEIHRLLREIGREIDAYDLHVTLTYTDSGEAVMDTIVLRDDNKAGVNLTLALTDAAGAPATVPHAPTWAVDNSFVVTVTPAADGMTAQVAPGTALGSATLTVTATNADGTTAICTQAISSISSDAVKAALRLTPVAAATPAVSGATA